MESGDTNPLIWRCWFGPRSYSRLLPIHETLATSAVTAHLPGLAESFQFPACQEWGLGSDMAPLRDPEDDSHGFTSALILLFGVMTI